MCGILILVPALVEDNEGDSRNIYLFYRVGPQSREYPRLFRYETHVHVLHEASEKKRRVFFHSTHTRTTTCTKTGSGIYVFPRADSDVPSRQLGDARVLSAHKTTSLILYTVEIFLSSLLSHLLRP